MEKLNVGDYITVDRWLNHRDLSRVGNILKVLIIDYPFIVVEDLSMDIVFLKRKTLDLREVAIKPLSDEFVSAALGDDWEEEIY